MNRTELTELIQNGENSGVEFKRDDIVPGEAGQGDGGASQSARAATSSSVSRTTALCLG